MILRLPIALVLLCMSLDASAVRARVVLVLKAEAVVASAHDLRLATLTEVDTPDVALRDRLHMQPLQVVGATGGALRIDRRQLQYALEWKMPALRGRLSWRGAEYAVLHGVERSNDAVRIEELAIRSLRQVEVVDEPGAGLRRVSEFRARIVPAGDIVLESLSGARDDRRNPVCVPVAIRIDRRPYETFSTCFVASTASRVPDARWAQPSGGQDVPPGHPLIRTRQEVRVRVQMPAVSIETTGIALGPGVPGAQIKVLNPRSQGQFVGVVTDDATVVVGNF